MGEVGSWVRGLGFGGEGGSLSRPREWVGRPVSGQVEAAGPRPSWAKGVLFPVCVLFYLFLFSIFF